MKKEPDRIAPPDPSCGLEDLFVAFCIGGKEPPSVRPRGGESRLVPFFCGPIEAEEVSHPFLNRKRGLSIGAVKIDEKGLTCDHQDIFELEVAMKKTRVMKSPEKEADVADRSSFGRKVIGETRLSFLEIFNEIQCLGNLYGKKVSPIEEGRDRLADSPYRLDGRNPGGSDLLRQGELPKGPRSEEKEAFGKSS
jgi:hypothetical protein